MASLTLDSYSGEARRRVHSIRGAVWHRISYAAAFAVLTKSCQFSVKMSGSCRVLPRFASLPLGPCTTDAHGEARVRAV